MTESKAVATKSPSEPDDLEQQLLETAKTPAERQQAYGLASQARQAEMIRRVATAMAEIGWGKDISPTARAATIRYCFEIGADPMRHVYVLGGNIFIGGAYYREAVAQHTNYLYAEDPEWIHDDERLPKADRDERAAKRIMHNIPDTDVGCCVVRIHLKGETEDRIVVGLGRARGGKNANNKPRDPVGQEFPRETAETRAWRECGEKIIGPWLSTHAPKLKAAQQIITSAAVLGTSAEVLDLPPDATVEKQRLLAANAESVPVEPETCNHNPSAKCGIEGVHLVAECGYHAKS